MHRAALFILLAFSLAFTFTFGSLAAQEKKKEEKKVEKKNPLDEEILQKTVGEWIKILRTGKDIKLKRVALIALEASDTAGTSGLSALIAATDETKEKEPLIRQEAVALLGRLPTDTRGAMKTLVEVLQTDKSGDVREEAALAIGGRFSKQAPDYISALIERLMKDDHVGTRIAVAVTLRNMGAEKDPFDKGKLSDKVKPALPALFIAANDANENQQVRAAALHVLSRHSKDNEQTLPLLLNLLHGYKLTDEEKAKVTDPQEQKKLINDKKKKLMPLREAAIDGLGRSESNAPDVIAALCETLTEENVELRKASAVALVALGSKTKSGWPTIKERVGFKIKGDDAQPIEPDSSVRNHLIRLTGTLAKSNSEAIKSLTDVAIHDTSTENRIAAIQEMGELPSLPKETRDELSKIAREDARQAIREAAAKSLKRVGGS